MFYSIYRLFWSSSSPNICIFSSYIFIYFWCNYTVIRNIFFVISTFWNLFRLILVLSTTWLILTIFYVHLYVFPHCSKFYLLMRTFLATMWVFFGRTETKVETPILWPPHAKTWLIGKDSDAGRDSGQEEKGTTEVEMAGWHHPVDGHEFGWTPGVGDGQGSLAFCNSWGRKESDATEWLNWPDGVQI